MKETLPEYFQLYATLESQIDGLGAQVAQEAGRPYLLGVTSAVDGEGKTTVALHLAMSAARHSGRRVGLVDLSLSGDTLCERLDVSPPDAGIVTALEESDRSLHALPLEGWHDLSLVPAGRPPANPGRLARSPRVAEVMKELRARFDVAIVDLPSVTSNNAAALARHLDGIVMVVCAGATPRELILRSLEHLGRDRVLGVVLNRVKSAAPRWVRQRLVPA